jgi:hypothetical protein
MDIALRIMVLERRGCEDTTCKSTSGRIARTVAALAGFDFVTILIQVLLALDRQSAR